MVMVMDTWSNKKVQNLESHHSGQNIRRKTYNPLIFHRKQQLLMFLFTNNICHSIHEPHTHTHKIIMLKSECVEINAELKKNKKNKNILGVSQKLELWVLKFWLVTGNISLFPQFYGNQISQVKNRVSFTCFVLLYKRHSKNMAVFLKCGMLVTVFSLNMWKYNI